MRKSRSITLTVLAGLVLTGAGVAGCNRPRAEPPPEPEPDQEEQPNPDTTWYDANGNPIKEEWKTDANGNRVLDEEGRPIPHPHAPYDRQGRPWTYRHGTWLPLPILIPLGSRSPARYGRSTPWWGGSGTRSSSGGSPSPSRSAAPSSVGRGGFGSTGSGSGG